MPRYAYTAPITTVSGQTRTETGTVEQPSPMFISVRARAEVANHVRRGLLKPGERFDANDIQLRAY